MLIRTVASVSTQEASVPVVPTSYAAPTYNNAVRERLDSVMMSIMYLALFHSRQDFARDPAMFSVVKEWTVKRNVHQGSANGLTQSIAGQNLETGVFATLWKFKGYLGNGIS